VELSSTISGDTWVLTNIYAPCTAEIKQEFLDWFHNYDMPVDVDWLLVGYFNLIKKPQDRNKTGGNAREMTDFNAAINSHGLEELKLYGSKYTWTNKQLSPLLERLDWFFCSTTWMTNYLGSSVSTLSSDNSDHTPCLVKMSTDIPKARVFRFENCWMLHGDFLQNMEHGWNVPVTREDRTMKVTTKF
jgi:hypothetical protein